MWHAKISKQRLQSMLPDLDLEADLDSNAFLSCLCIDEFVGQALDAIKEVMDLAMQDSLV